MPTGILFVGQGFSLAKEPVKCNLKRLPYILLTVGFLTLFSENAHAMKILPLFDFSLGVGNSFFGDTVSGFGGDAYLDFTPIMKINEDIDILPRLSIRYQGNRRILELSGGGSLFQQVLDGSFSVKYIQKVNEELKVKFNAGYKKELLQETVNEPLGQGLYDYDKYGAGLELEQEQVRGGYNFYIMRFPRYTSLASTSPDTQYKELAGGTYVLDYNANEVFASGRKMLSEEIMGKYGYTYTRADYIDQKVINDTGGYVSDKRCDNIHNLNAGLVWFLPENRLGSILYAPTIGLSYNLAWYQSNQNHYDAEQVYYIPSFYDYLQNKISPSLNVNFPITEMDLTFVYEYAYRGYINRLAQDTSGVYGTEKMDLQTHSILLYVNYPVLERLSIFLSCGLSYSLSNNRYEKVYMYNYSSGNYLLGVSYKY